MVCLGPQWSANICKVCWGRVELQSRGHSALKITCVCVCVCVCSIQVIFSVIQVSFEKLKFSCNQIWVKDATGVTLYDNEFKCRAPRSKLYRKCEIGIMLKVVSSVTTIETQFIDANWGIWVEIWGCCLGMGDVKDYSGGVVKSHNFHFVYFIDILQDICFKLAMKMRIINSSHNQPKNRRKSYVSVIFQKKLIFMYIFNTFKFARARWLKWCHGDVIWSSVVLIMISVDREDPYLYTGSKYRGIKHSVQKIQGGDCNNPLLRMCYKKYLIRRRIKWKDMKM